MLWWPDHFLATLLSGLELASWGWDSMASSPLMLQRSGPSVLNHEATNERDKIPRSPCLHIAEWHRTTKHRNGEAQVADWDTSCVYSAIQKHVFPRPLRSLRILVWRQDRIRRTVQSQLRLLAMQLEHFSAAQLWDLWQPTGTGHDSS